MNWLDYVNAAASFATAVGVLIAVWQIRLGKQQATTQFEDGLNQQYREIIRRIPIQVLLGEEVSEEVYQSTLDDFYRYIDLTNEQVFLRENDRVTKQTWQLWNDGIKSTLRKKSFARAWEYIQEQAPDDFKELKKLEASNFEADPLSKRKFLLF